jgi:uncharacterized protein
VWIDIDNTPHVPFFRPIIRELRSRGIDTLVTARDAFQVCELAAQLRVDVRRVGRHYGKNVLLKSWGLCWRSAQLLPIVLQERPAIAVSHGARSQILLSNLLRIPTIMIADYEHVATPPLVRPKWEIVPHVLPASRLHCTDRQRIRTYAGIKEDVYASELNPDPALLDELDLPGDHVIVTVRPPANEAHYHRPESDELFVHFMHRVCRTPGITAVLLPRNRVQERDIRATFPAWFESGRVIVPGRAVDGLNLLWHSDLVVSGGGTMNREAAALGVPVYSIFRGATGAVDRHLEAKGRLRLITSRDEVERRIPLVRRSRGVPPAAARGGAREEIVTHILNILDIETSAGWSEDRQTPCPRSS